MSLEGFERGARMLFSFPRLEILVLLTITAFTVAVYLGCSPLCLAYVTFALPLILKLSAPRLITAKRALGLTPFLIAWCTLATLLRGYSPLLLTPPSLLFSTVTRLLSNRHTWPLLILASAGAAILLEGGGLTALAVHAALSTALVSSTELYICKLKRDLHEFGGIETLTAYLNYTLGGAREQLASLLARISVERCIPVYALDLLDENGVWGTIVIPHVHPGPFRNFGSSRLPRMLVEEAQRHGLFCMVLHGASTHSEDLAREEDAEVLVKQVLAGFGEALCAGCSLGIAERSNGTHRVVALALEGGWSLAVVERVDGGMEDIPLSLAEAVGPNVVLVDAHNSYDEACPSPAPGDPLWVSVAQCTTLAVQAARAGMTGDWSIAAAQRPGRLGSELGHAGIAVLQLKRGSGSSLLIVAFDANNMVRKARDLLYTRLHKPGTIASIVTTDTHELTGARPGSTYDPLGTKQHINTYIDLLEELIGDTAFTKPLRYRLRVLNYTSKYLDLSKLQKLGRVVDSLITRALALFAFCFATFTVPLFV